MADFVPFMRVYTAFIGNLFTDVRHILLDFLSPQPYFLPQDQRRGDSRAAAAFIMEDVMAQFDLAKHALVGTSGNLPVREEDEITRKLAMLIEGECDGLGPSKAADKFGFSKQRYFQLRAAFDDLGAAGLQSHKRGPKTLYRRTAETVRQVIRHRFLDPEATAEVIAQKLTQSGRKISIRSVERVIEEFGLQKKTLPVSAKR